MSKPIYCFETKKRFSSVLDVTKELGFKSENSIRDVIDNPNRTSGGYHWCTDLNIFDGIKLVSGRGKPIYCFETGEYYKSISAAAKEVGIDSETLREVINNPNRTAKSYHWCTSLDVFDGVDLNHGQNKPVYCYETKQKFESIKEASDWCGLSGNGFNYALNQPDKTLMNYHWCTSLDVFEGMVLTQKKVPVYCYETKQKFESMTDAAIFYGCGEWNIRSVLDKHDRVMQDLHFCTDLSIFYELDLTVWSRNKPVYCYETKQKFESMANASYSIGHNSNSTLCEVVDNPIRTAGGFHWCTDLSVFDNHNLKARNGTPVFCYQTKEKFDTMTLAAEWCGFSNPTPISQAADNPYATSNGYHWCTDLSIFDGKELIYPNSGISGKEKEVLDFVKPLTDNIKENSRKIISPLELDIHLPDNNFAIEFNGNYWHSEASGKSKDYHIMKTNMCKEKGIKLLHIFEHQWNNKSEIFKSVIANKLGKSEKIYARKCKVVELKDCKKFLESNHLQGNCPSSIKLGLTYNDELVSVMTFGKPRFNKSYEYELIRFCNKLNTSVVGGASKLLKYFEKHYSPKSLVSYANLQWSDGGLYNQLGFTFKEVSIPNYWWVKSTRTLTRYQCQKHKLKDLLGDKFNPELSEKDNMENNGYSRLFDCGNIIFIKNY